MSLLRTLTALLALALAGAGLILAQEQPLAAGSNGVPVPKKKKHVQPVYPPEALAQGIRGIVILELVIDTEGRVTETSIIRSIPGLNEAAVTAARQWQYEPVKVDGKPVSVRLTVPITFALKLPDVERQKGIPELRQGVTPPWPQGVQGEAGTAVAEVTLEPDGRIGLARIVEGAEPWSTSLLQALRTWRFQPPPPDATVSFRVEAEFAPDRDRGRVALSLTGLHQSEILPDSAEAADLSLPAELEATPAAEPEAPEEGGATAVEAPAEETSSPEAAAAAPQPTTEAGAGEAPEAESADVSPGEEGPEAVEQPTPGSPTAVAEARPEGTVPQVIEEAVPPPPPIEILSVPLPPENGISAIRGVDLEPGVPDLTRGRRPVSPPFARMEGASGTVTVEFTVSGGGVTSVQRVEGPEILKPAATGAVESWTFRRTRTDRAYLVATFTYEDDLASAVVKPQQQP